MNLGYVISITIASVILLSVTALNLRVSRSSGEQTLYTMINSQSELVSEFISYDLRQVGYGINDTLAITSADSNHIRYLVHFEGDVDRTEIEWKFDPIQSSTNGNPNVRTLFRIVDGVDLHISTAITSFRLTYLDEQRQPIATDIQGLSGIRQIRIEFVTESMESYSGTRFVSTTWTGEVTPFNLN